MADRCSGPQDRLEETAKLIAVRGKKALSGGRSAVFLLTANINRQDSFFRGGGWDKNKIRQPHTARWLPAPQAGPQAIFYKLRS